jgi:ATP-dependent Clp protease ATP-binding subunit ClpC
LGVINEAAGDPNIIIFIDEIHMIVGAGASGGSGNMDIANILKPYLTNGDLRIIGATTFDEYQKYFEDDDALARRFQTLSVNEISVADAQKVMEMLRPQFEKFHNVKIPNEVMAEAIDLSNRYITNKYLPDKSIDVIDEAAAAKKIEIQAKEIGSDKLDQELNSILDAKEQALDKGDINSAASLRKKEAQILKKIDSYEQKRSQKLLKKAIITKEDIRKVISRWSNIPITSMQRSDIRSIQALDTNLMKRIIGQDKAISAVSGALKRARIGLSDAKRPMASFIFLGPTGVGKTETAKEISRTLFGTEKALIQVDMSEYMEAHSVSKLIGSPPGYVGYQEGGQLTEKVRRQPYSIVLFDEIEKAHPELINILLQILEEGRVQDARGRSVNFKNTVIIMTSNIGAQEVNNDAILGFGVDASSTDETEKDSAYIKLEENILEELKNTLPPEFLNRIDNTLIFRGLDEDDAYRIAKILLNELNDRIVKKGVQLLPTTAVIRLIANKGFDKEFGARNIKRKIQELVENPLADYLIDNNLVNEDSKKVVKVKLEKENEKIVFNKY